MLRKLLGAVAALALPALLAGQTPGTPRPKAALTRGIATQVQGEVVRPEAAAVKETNGPNNDVQDGEKDGQNNDVQDGEQDGPNNDVQDGEQDGPNNDVQDGEPNGQNGDSGVKDGNGPNDDGATASAQASKVGRHRP